jgi:manganese/iron transport system permease protein
MSCLLVLKGWSLMGDAIAHAVLPGIVLAYILGIPIVLGAFAAGLFCAVATGYFTEHSRIKEDTAMGVVFSGMFALGIVLFSYIHTNLHLDHVLFGNMLGVVTTDIVLTGVIAAFVVAVFLLKRRDILVFAFDPQHATVMGINTRYMQYGLLALLALVIVASIKAVGIILIIAVLIAPGAISFLLTDRFETMLLIAALVSAFCTITGVLTSFYLDSAPAPTIVVLMTVIFILTFLFAPKRGLWRTKDLLNAAYYKQP